MFGSGKQGIAAYNGIGLETRVASASPLQLINMMYESSVVALDQAIMFIEQGNIERKGALLSKAIAIVDDGLYASLNFEKGGEIAKNLGELYRYITEQLLMANLQNDVERIKECIGLLKQLQSAWQELELKTQTASETISSAA